MKTIGLFEAKTKLSEICELVARQGEPVLVTRRGKPLVRIEPAADEAKSASVWDLRAEYIKKHGPAADDFSLPARETQEWRNYLADESE